MSYTLMQLGRNSDIAFELRETKKNGDVIFQQVRGSTEWHKTNFYGNYTIYGWNIPIASFNNRKFGKVIHTYDTLEEFISDHFEDIL